MSTVIQIKNLSKQYRLGQVGTGTISRDLQGWWAKIRGKENPNLKIGSENRLDTVDGEYVWVLRNISFEVKQGEVLGIIGKNGAGKSTLLKILSRVTTPTAGEINVKGRIASLLEVGTGFNPELTGRENIFLNGAILGMTKAEIKSKLDEIIDFSGVEKYIDTPVKRYSSGMYVRLAFAVAAHLDPEILVIDEVLAVGDAEFQKKCLGKMGDVSKEGRTVLFVSHNMSAIQSLCPKAILLHKGNIVGNGISNEIVNKYLSFNNKSNIEKEWKNLKDAPGNDIIRIISVKINCINENIIINLATSFAIDIIFTMTKQISLFYIGFHLDTILEQKVFVTSSIPQEITEGQYMSRCFVPANLLNTNIYKIDVYFVEGPTTVLYLAENLLSFEVNDIPRVKGSFLGTIPGAVRPLLKWEINKI